MSSKHVTAEPGHPSMRDLAHAAGVSLATADRVINRRKGVKQRTAHRVLEVARDIGFLSEAEMVRYTTTRPPNIVFLLPAGRNPYLRLLGERLRARAAKASPQPQTIRCFFIDSFSVSALADALRRHRQWADGIVFFAIDHPQVREAVGDVAAGGTRLVTLVSDLQHPGRSAYVGLENHSVGRTAGLLIARFCAARSGSIALVAGSRNYRAHSEREAGFLSIMEELAPHLEIIGMREGHDDSGENYRHTIAILEQNPDLIGIYNVGGSSSGIARALEERNRSDIVFIGHGLTADTRASLVRGTMDAVLDVDPDRLLDCAIEQITLPEPGGENPRIKLDIYFRENIP